MKTRHLVVHTAKREDGAPGRYGLVVSRKAGNAVVRNRLRRQLRAAVAMAGGIKAGHDSVIILRTANGLTTQVALEDLTVVMAKTGMAGKGDG